MPRLRTTVFKAHLAWTRIPNFVLDRLLPSLRDTELRILLVLLRQTVGWNRPDATVVLSYRRLKAATGRESEAISKALASLAAKGLSTSTEGRPFALRRVLLRSSKNNKRQERKKEQPTPVRYPQGKRCKQTGWDGRVTRTLTLGAQPAIPVRLRRN